MPSYVVHCKNNATQADIDEAKKFASEKGGTDVDQYQIIKAFRVDFDRDNNPTATMESHHAVQSVELDKGVEIQ